MIRLWIWKVMVDSESDVNRVVDMVVDVLPPSNSDYELMRNKHFQIGHYYCTRDVLFRGPNVLRYYSSG